MNDHPHRPKRNHRAYDLLPRNLVQRIPSLGTTDGKPDRLAYVRLFTPDSSRAWYVVEYDPERRLCFGLVSSPLELLLGDFFLDQLEGLRGPLGMAVERDLRWKPQSLTHCRQEAAKAREQTCRQGDS